MFLTRAIKSCPFKPYPTEHPRPIVYSITSVPSWRFADTAPRWVLRDRDAIYGEQFCQRVAGMGITEVVSAPSSPWQNPYVERLIGSLRRECLDHVIVLSEAHLRRVLA